MKRTKIIKIIFLLTIIISLFFTCNIIIQKSKFKVELKNKTMNFGEEYRNDFHATFKGKNVTDKVQVTNNIYNTKIGKYQITFTYLSGKREYTVTKKITIKDNEQPQIELLGRPDMVIKKGEKYVEPGYHATDNYDGEITKKVKIEGMVDSTKEGVYNLKYSVSDSSKNKKTVERVVKVINN